MLFLKLPYVVQSSILNFMELHEQFFLGLCSKRAKLVVRLIPREFNKSIINMQQRCIELQKAGFRGVEFLKWCSSTYPPHMEHLVPEKSERCRKIKFWYNNVRIRCDVSYHPETRSPIIWHKEKFKRQVPMALHFAVCDVFNLSREIQISFYIDRDFPDTDVVDNLIDMSWETDPEVFKKFFEKVKVRNCLQIFSHYVDLGNDLNFLSTKHIFMFASKLVTRKWLTNFQGKSATFMFTEQIFTEDLIAFIENWKIGGNSNLESIFLTVKRETNSVFDVDKILAIAGAKPWDPKKRGARFKFPSTRRLCFYHDFLDCTKQLDVQRKTDGVLATIRIEPKLFCFFVWLDPFPETTPISVQRMNIFTND